MRVIARAPTIKAMESAVKGEGINICAGQDTSQLRIMEIVTQACGSSLKVESRTETTGAKLPPAKAQGYSRDKAKRLLGWEPRLSIEAGIGRVLRWVDQQRTDARQAPG